MNPTQGLDWWQRSDLCYSQGRLVFAGHDVEALARRYGTPSFVYSLARVKANLERLHGALGRANLSQGYTILYAMKANRFGPLLTAMHLSGLCGIDACSPNEVEHAVSCGFKPSQISFTAGSLSRKDLDVLARYDGIFMDCDSLHALRAWGERKPGTSVGIRVNPALGVSRADNAHLSYAGNVTTKFGIYSEQFDEALEIAKHYRLAVTKIHFHTGCGYLTPELGQLDQVIEACLGFVDRAGTIQTVNIGGGLGVPHTAADGTIDLDRWAAVLHKHFALRNVKVEIEPGEYILKDAGLLLLGKTYLETKRDLRLLGVDAGFNVAPEPAYYQLPFLPVAMVMEEGAAMEKVTVVGNINEALDVWYRDALLPDMSGQPYLALINAGAYSASMASNHCMRGEWKEFLLT